MTIDYFMDKLEIWEINDIMENLPYLDRTIWETARLNGYITAQVNSKKKLKPQDICKFKWDDEEKEVEITKKDINRLKAKANEYLQHTGNRKGFNGAIKEDR